MPIRLHLRIFLGEEALDGPGPGLVEAALPGDGRQSRGREVPRGLEGGGQEERRPESHSGQGLQMRHHISQLTACADLLACNDIS